MGLDQYVYHFKPISKLEARAFQGAKMEAIPNKFAIFPLMDGMNEKNPLYEDLHKVGHEITFLEPIFMSEEMEKDYGIDSSSTKRRYSNFHEDDSVEIVYSFLDGAERKITLSDEQFRKYIKHVEEEAIITRQPKEVYYWRKWWNLDYELGEVLEKKGTIIDNCGFYLLDEECLSVMASMSKGFAERLELIEMKDKDNLFYHLWY